MATRQKRPTVPPDDPMQSERFIETSKTVGATDGSMFVRVFKKIVPRKRTQKAS